MAGAFHYLVTPSGAKIAQRRKDLARLTGAPEDDIAAPLEKLAGGDARILRPVDDAPSLRDLPRRPRAAAARLAGALPCGEAPAPRGRPRHGGRGRRRDRARARRIHPPAGVAREGRAEDARHPVRAPRRRPGRTRHRRRRPRRREPGRARSRRRPDPAASPRPHDRHPADGRCRGDRLRRRVPRADPRGRGAQGGDRARRPAAAARRHPDRQRGPGRDPGRSRRRAAGERRVRRVPDRGGRRLPRGRRVGRPLRRRPVRARHPPAGELRGRRRGPGRRPGRALRAGLDRLPRARAHVPARSVHGRARGVDPRRFEGKVVVVGTSARKQGDLHATAAGGGRVMSGAEIQANAISTLRRGTPLDELGAAADVALIVLLGLLPAVAAIAMPPSARRGSSRPGAGGHLPRRWRSCCSPRAGSSPCCIPCSPWVCPPPACSRPAPQARGDSAARADAHALAMAGAPRRRARREAIQRARPPAPSERCSPVATTSPVAFRSRAKVAAS